MIASVQFAEGLSAINLEEIIKSSTYPLDFHQNVRHVCSWRMNSNDEPVYSPELDGTWMVKPCPR